MPECATPAIPTATSLTTGLTGLIQRLIRSDQPESTKRAIAILAACTLCLCAFALTLTIEVQAIQTGHVDAQLAWITAGAYTAVAGLAGVAYRKADDGGANA